MRAGLACSLVLGLMVVHLAMADWHCTSSETADQSSSVAMAWWFFRLASVVAKFELRDKEHAGLPACLDV